MAGDTPSSQAPLRGGRRTDSGHGDQLRAEVSRRSESGPALESDIRLTLPARPENGEALDVIVSDRGPGAGSRLVSFLRLRREPALGIA